MKITRTIKETLDFPDEMSVEEAAQLLQNPPEAVLVEDEDDEDPADADADADEDEDEDEDDDPADAEE